MQQTLKIESESSPLTIFWNNTADKWVSSAFSWCFKTSRKHCRRGRTKSGVWQSLTNMFLSWKGLRGNGEQLHVVSC